MPQLKELLEEAHDILSFSTVYPGFIDLINFLVSFGHCRQVLQHDIEVER